MLIATTNDLPGHEVEGAAAVHKGRPTIFRQQYQGIQSRRLASGEHDLELRLRSP